MYEKEAIAKQKFEQGSRLKKKAIKTKYKMVSEPFASTSYVLPSFFHFFSIFCFILILLVRTRTDRHLTHNKHCSVAEKAEVFLELIRFLPILGSFHSISMMGFPLRSEKNERTAMFSGSPANDPQFSKFSGDI